MSPWTHLEWAHSLPRVSGFSPLPPVLAHAVQRSSAMSVAELNALRAERLDYWRKRERVTSQAWQRERADLPSHVRQVLGPDKNLRLLAEIASAMEWPDSALVVDLARGFPLLGRLPSSGISPPQEYTVVHACPASLLESAPEANDSTMDRIRRSVIGDASVADAFKSKCAEEVESGKALWTKLSPTNSIITARFPVLEGFREDAEGNLILRVRLVDDFSDSGVNSATSIGEPLPVDTLDTLVSLASALIAERGERAAIRFRKEDFKGAFKSLPICGEHLPFAVVSWASAAAADKGLQLLACPFGALSSVHSWHRFGSFVQAFLAQEFLIATPRFVDDFFSADREETDQHELAGPAGSANRTRQVIGLLGWELDPKKAVQDTPCTTVLGVCARAWPGAIAFWIGDEKREKWLKCIDCALESQCLRPAEAKRLAGRLGWGGYVVFGRGARAYLSALHWQANRTSGNVPRRVRNALLWWRRFLLACPTRIVPLTPREVQRCFVYTDAAGDGQIALVLWHPTVRIWAAASVPAAARRWARPRRTQIALWELLAAICSLQFLIENGLKDCEVVSFIDSTVALHTLIRGASRQNDYNDVVNDFWFTVAGAGLLLHAARVPSKLNLADGPTRMHSFEASRADLAERGFRQVQWEWPTRMPWDA